MSCAGNETNIKMVMTNSKAMVFGLGVVHMMYETNLFNSSIKFKIFTLKSLLKISEFSCYGIKFSISIIKCLSLSPSLLFLSKYY